MEPGTPQLEPVAIVICTYTLLLLEGQTDEAKRIAVSEMGSLDRKVLSLRSLLDSFDTHSKAQVKSL
jgi:hypothetical protein